MSYMEQAMQTQMDGAIALQNQICDEACEIYKEIYLTPRQLMQQRAELLEALKKIAAIPNKDFGSDWEEIEEARTISMMAIQKAYE